jgi:hypothetical protein
MTEVATAVLARRAAMRVLENILMYRVCRINWIVEDIRGMKCCLSW